MAVRRPASAPAPAIDDRSRLRRTSEMTEDVRVRHLDGDRFAVDVRNHTLLVDQPLDVGGTDTAPTPTELFIAGLASCVAFYARRYAVLAVASHCTVHNTLTEPPTIAVALAVDAVDAR